jgi:hypothetical protein
MEPLTQFTTPSPIKAYPAKRPADAPRINTCFLKNLHKSYDAKIIVSTFIPSTWVKI